MGQLGSAWMLIIEPSMGCEGSGGMVKKVGKSNVVFGSSGPIPWKVYSNGRGANGVPSI